MSSWSSLQDGAPGGPAVLAVDFEPGRGDAGFPDMVPHLPGDLTVLATEAPRRSTVDRALTEWLAEAPVGDGRVAAVLGFCAGATVASWLAYEIGKGAPAPALVLLDPSRADAGLLRAEFVKAASGLLRAAGEPAVEPAAGEADLPALADQLSAEYAGIVRRVAPIIEVDDDLAEDLAGRFADYLRYLAVAGGTAWPPVTDEERTLTLVSARFDGDTPMPGRRVRMDVERADFLADRGVALAVTASIGR
jgi:hypothetical protein